MSCVADANAISQNTARVAWKNPEAGRVKAIATMAMPMVHCMASTHHLLVRMISTKGLQNGFITHGR